MQNRLSDPKYLKIQYKNADPLSARMYIHEHYSTNQKDWHEWVYDHIDLKSNVNVLEVGAGPGKIWQTNIQRMKKENLVVLTDFSMGMLRNARNHNLSQKPFAFSNLGAERLPFPAQFFDLVIANHMLYHVPDIERAVKEIARVIKLEGLFLAATNGIRHMVEMHELVSSIDKPLEDPGWFVRRFSLQNGEKILASAFSSIELDEYHDSLEITEADPLIAYIQSIWDDQIEATQLDELKKRIDEVIKQKGSFHIEKQTGLFVCRNPIKNL